VDQSLLGHLENNISINKKDFNISQVDAGNVKEAKKNSLKRNRCHK